VSTYSRLGKGLESLIPSGTDTVLSETTNEIKLELISVNPFQPRQVFNEEALFALRDSVKQYGVAQPILVRPKDGKYELIAGERRFRASQLAGLDSIPVVVKDYTDEESLQIALIENLDREDLNAIEEARGYKRLIEEFSYSQQDVASSVHKSRSAVANTLRLLQLPELVQDGIMNQDISEGHGRALLGLKESHLISILYKEICQQELSVRQTEARVTLLNFPKVAENHKQDMSEISKRLSLNAGFNAKIKGTERHGVVELKYTSSQELEALMKRLSV
jgi:ParB family transcriptional regulator, chromosome partitioning protein